MQKEGDIDAASSKKRPLTRDEKMTIGALTATVLFWAYIKVGAPAGFVGIVAVFALGFVVSVLAGRYVRL